MNVVAHAWFNVLISQYWKNQSFMLKWLVSVYGPGEFRPLYSPTNIDFMFFYICSNKVYGGYRGTEGGRAWLNNAKCIDFNNTGFHPGFVESFDCFKESVLSIIDSNSGKEFINGAHSRGCAFNTLTSYNAQLKLKKYIKPINFCPPMLVDERGARILRSTCVDQLNLLQGNDPVDNIGIDGFFGVHHGDTIQLPNKEYTWREKLRDLIPFIGHAPREVTDGLYEWFKRRGLVEEQKFIKAIRHLAKI